MTEQVDWCWQRWRGNFLDKSDADISRKLSQNYAKKIRKKNVCRGKRSKGKHRKLNFHVRLGISLGDENCQIEIATKKKVKSGEIFLSLENAKIELNYDSFATRQNSIFICRRFLHPKWPFNIPSNRLSRIIAKGIRAWLEFIGKQTDKQANKTFSSSPSR